MLSPLVLFKNTCVIFFEFWDVPPYSLHVKQMLQK